LIENSRWEYTPGIENELAQTFNDREGAVLKQSRTSIHQIVIFMLEYYRKRRTSASFVKSVNIAGVEAVRVFSTQNKFEEAYHTAIRTLEYTRAHGGYRAAADMSYGFKLPLYMADRCGVPKVQDVELRKMLDLYRKVL